MQANDLRRGMVVIFNGELCKILEFHHHTPGNLRAMVQVKLQVQFYEGRPFGVELPKTVKAKIVETQPMMKGATASASYKPATLENGVVVQVPPFVTAGEEIIVDPSENRYIERAR